MVKSFQGREQLAILLFTWHHIISFSGSNIVRTCLACVVAGVAYSQAVPYVFGVPFMNETVMSESFIQPRQFYDHEDRNMSEFMMYMWTNFVKEGCVNWLLLGHVVYSATWSAEGVLHELNLC